jgi:putative hydrolase
MGPGNPFGFDFSQLVRMLQSQGPVNLDVARQLASYIATHDTAGQPTGERPVEAETVAAFDDLVRAAQTAVADATGIAAALTVPARSVDRAAWTATTLDGLAPVLEALARALRGPERPPETGAGAEGDALMGMLLQTMLPFLLGVWAGVMIGQLSHQALGQYDLPLPLDAPPALLFVSRNVDDFARAWSLPLDESRYALVLREVVHGAQRSVGWVRARLTRLASDYVGAYEVQPDAFEELLGEIDFGSAEPLQAMGTFGDPGALLGAMRSERQGPLLEELQRFVSVLEGHTDVVVDHLGARMVPSHTRIDEALRRHRLERGEAAAFVDRLLGLELDRHHYEEGVAFCRGVVERAGLEGLHRLWEREEMLPTRAELEAPGLWLARIDLPEG